MNQGALIAVILLAVAAVVGVLFMPMDSAPMEALSGLTDPDLQQSEQEPGEARYEASGNRTEAQPSAAEQELDPNAVVGQVFGPDNRPVSRARVVFAHKQFGGSSLGWTLQGVLQAGIGADEQGRFRLPISDGKSEDLEVVAVAPGMTPTRVRGLAAGESTTIRLRRQLLVPGTVLAPNGEPAAGVPVELFDPRGQTDGLPSVAMTDAQGQFELRTPGAGSYGLRVRSALGSEFLRENYSITEAADPIAIRLSGELAVELTLVDDRGQQVAGASVTVNGGKSAPPRRASSDRSGIVRLYGLPSGRYSVRVEAEGLAPLDQAVAYQGSTIQETWTLGRFAAVRVTAVNGKNRPLPGAQLRLLADPTLPRANERTLQATTDADGVARFGEVPPGRYVLTPESRAGHQPGALFEEDAAPNGEAGEKFALLLDIASGEERNERLVLQRHGFLNVSVTRQGDPVVGARGSIKRGIGPRAEDLEALDLSDLDGLLVFPSVWSDEYEIEVQASPQALPSRRVVKVGRGGNKVGFEVPGGVVRGQVLGASGPIAGARILAARKGERLKEYLRSDADGRFVLEGFEAAEYQLRIEATGLTPWQNPAFQHDGGEIVLGAIQMGAAYKVQGQVHGLAAAEGLFGPMLSVEDLNGNAIQSLSLPSDGRFALDGLAAGSYLLKVFHEGSEVAAQAIQVPGDGASIELHVR